MQSNPHSNAPHGDSAASAGDRDALVRVLFEVCRALDLSASLTQIRDALQQNAAAGESATSLESLAATTESLGIHATPVECNVAKAVSQTGARTVLLRKLGQTDWLAILASAGRKSQVFQFTTSSMRADWLSPSQICKILGTKSGDDGEWIVLQPIMPLQPSAATDDHPLTPFQRLVAFMTPERRDLGVVTVFSIGVGILSLATPIAVQQLVNLVAFGGLLQPVFVLGLLLFAFLAFAGAVRALQTWVVEIVQRRIFVRVVADLAHRLPNVQTHALDRRNGPELANRFFDIVTIQKTAAAILLDGIAIVLQAFVGLVILAFYHPVLLGFDLILVGAILAIIWLVGRGAVKTAVYESKAKFAVGALLEEFLRAPDAYRSRHGASVAVERADELVTAYITHRHNHFRIVLRQIVSAITLQVLAGTALLTLGGWLVIRGELTLGQLVAAELIVSGVLAGVTKFGKHLENFYDLLAAADKLGILIDLPTERTDGSMVPLNTSAPQLSAHGIACFRDGSNVFSDLNLLLHRGERMVIFGPHASGKSTLAEMLYGLRSPSAGCIEYCGQDIDDTNPRAYRDKVMLIRAGELLEDTIIENIRLRRSGVSAADVRHALEALDLHDVVRSLPDGNHTRLNYNGAPLSSGQARLLFLARAMVARPDLLIVDGLLDDLDAAARRRALNVLTNPDAPWSLILLTSCRELTTGFEKCVNLPLPRGADSDDLATTRATATVNA